MEGFFVDVIIEKFLFNFVRVGAFVRWVFLKKKKSYKNVLKENWNGRVGILMFVFIVFLISKYNK